VQKKNPDSWAVFVKRDLMVQRLCKWHHWGEP